MNILVVIAARGGSKGVKNKNIRPLMGKPLISYTIGQALSWGKGSHVVVTTDSQAIAEAAKKYGAEVPFMRPPELAADTSPKVPVIRHALLESERIFGESFDIVVDLDPTAPVRQPGDLGACLERFIKHDADTLVSVVHAHKNPYFNMLEERSDGFVELCKKLPGGVYRRQDAPAVYAMNASIYFYKRGFLADEVNDFPVGERTVCHVMDESSSYDIDREIDFEFLEFMAERGRIDLG